MDHSMSAGGAECQMSMLWNWDTIDSCFLAESWQTRSGGEFAATCIGVILLVILVEFTRRLSREYDETIIRQFGRQASVSRARLSNTTDASVSASVTFRASPLQQLIRAFLYAITIAGAYILMLIAMSFNGYIIICIFIGAGIGKFLCDWLVVKVDLRASGISVKTGSKEEGEAAVCCA